MEDEERLDLSDDGADLDFGQGDYVVSQGTKACLHQVGRCYRVPGKDYATYKSFGRALPGPASYDYYCRSCWPDGGGAPLGVSDGSDGDSASTESEAATSLASS